MYKRRISSKTVLRTVVGSHINDGAGWRTKSVYPHIQRNVPSQDFSKHWLKDIYESDLKKQTTNTQFASMKITFKCVLYFCCYFLFPPLQIVKTHSSLSESIFLFWSSYSGTSPYISHTPCSQNHRVLLGRWFWQQITSPSP